VRLFPGDPAVIYDAAITLADGGDLSAAYDVVKTGLSINSDPQLHTRLAGLQGKLESALQSENAAPAGN
jgi:hypothetical protein